VLESAVCPLMPQHTLLNPDYNYTEFYSYVSEWLDFLTTTADVPTAIFACDFNMVDATLVALGAHGLGVPEQVSVIGFDDPNVASTMIPPLTALRQPVFEMGARAIDRLVAVLRSDNEPKIVRGTERMPCELVVRGTTAPPSTH